MSRPAWSGQSVQLRISKHLAPFICFRLTSLWVRLLPRASPCENPRRLCHTPLHAARFSSAPRGCGLSSATARLAQPEAPLWGTAIAQIASGRRRDFSISESGRTCSFLLPDTEGVFSSTTVLVFPRSRASALFFSCGERLVHYYPRGNGLRCRQNNALPARSLWSVVSGALF